MTDDATPKRRLIQRLMADRGIDYERSIERRRNQNESWETISRWIHTETLESVSAATLADWHTP